MKDLALSIIIPNYNSGENLKLALQSLEKELDRIHEVIIIDGNSDDGSVEFIRELSSPKIHVLSEPDNGIYDAMNKGIDMATGNWLYFMGADDRLKPGSIEKIIQYLHQPYLLVYGNVELPEGKICHGKIDWDELPLKTYPHQACFYSASVFDTIGKFDINYKMRADNVLNARITALGSDNVLFVDVVIAHYSPYGSSSKDIDKRYVSSAPSLYLDLFESKYGKKAIYKSLFNIYLLNIKYADFWKGVFGCFRSGLKFKVVKNILSAIMFRIGLKSNTIL